MPLDGDSSVGHTIEKVRMLYMFQRLPVSHTRLHDKIFEVGEGVSTAPFLAAEPMIYDAIATSEAPVGLPLAGRGQRPRTLHRDRLCVAWMIKQNSIGSG